MNAQLPVGRDLLNLFTLQPNPLHLAFLNCPPSGLPQLWHCRSLPPEDSCKPCQYWISWPPMKGCMYLVKTATMICLPTVHRVVLAIPVSPVTVHLQGKRTYIHSSWYHIPTCVCTLWNGPGQPEFSGNILWEEGQGHFIKSVHLSIIFNSNRHCWFF